MTVVFAVCAVLACVAWIAAEGRIQKLESNRQRLQERYDDLRREHEMTTRDLRAKRQLLADALALVPDSPRGRQIGDAIRLQVWPDRQQRRLARHLQLVDHEPVA